MALLAMTVFKVVAGNTVFEASLGSDTLSGSLGGGCAMACI